MSQPNTVRRAPDASPEDATSEGLRVRSPQASVDPIFVARWSPHAFSPEPIPRAQLETLFEAARWAPSSRNEQPWLFVYADAEDDLRRFRPLLEDANRLWADRAPVLAFLFARRAMRRTGAPNGWAAFDAGAAWMSLALQARQLGLYTRAIAGFHEDLVYPALAVPRDEYQAMAGIAIGRIGDRDALPPSLAQKEIPTGRRPLSEVAVRGRFGAAPEES